MLGIDVEGAIGKEVWKEEEFGNEIPFETRRRIKKLIEEERRRRDEAFFDKFIKIGTLGASIMAAFFSGLNLLFK